MIIYAYIYENLPLWKVFSSDIGYTSSSSWRPQYHPNDPRHKIMGSIDYQGQGRPSPSGRDAFPPCFRSPPLFSKNFKTLWKIYKILHFPEKISDFHPPKFLMTCFNKFPPCFRKIHQRFTCFACNFFPPTLTMMHLCITQCTYWTPLIRGANHFLK